MFGFVLLKKVPQVTKKCDNQGLFITPNQQFVKYNLLNRPHK